MAPQPIAAAAAARPPRAPARAAPAPRPRPAPAPPAPRAPRPAARRAPRPRSEKVPAQPEARGARTDARAPAGHTPSGARPGPPTSWRARGAGGARAGTAAQTSFNPGDGPAAWTGRSPGPGTGTQARPGTTAATWHLDLPRTRRPDLGAQQRGGSGGPRHPPGKDRGWPDSHSSRETLVKCESCAKERNSNNPGGCQSPDRPGVTQRDTPETRGGGGGGQG